MIGFHISYESLEGCRGFSKIYLKQSLSLQNIFRIISKQIFIQTLKYVNIFTYIILLMQFLLILSKLLILPTILDRKGGSQVKSAHLWKIRRNKIDTSLTILY